MVLERESFDFCRWDSKLYVRNGQNSATPAITLELSSWVEALDTSWILESKYFKINLHNGHDRCAQNRSEALLALPSNAANKKSKTTEHNASSSSSFLEVDTPTVNNPMEDSTAKAEQTSDSHNDNK